MNPRPLQAAAPAPSAAREKLVYFRLTLTSFDEHAAIGKLDNLSPFLMGMVGAAKARISK